MEATRQHGTLTFVESGDDYSTYHDRDGRPVYLQHETANILVPFGDIDLRAEYTTWLNRTVRHSYISFDDHLADMVTDPDEIDDYLVWCDDCGYPDTDGNLNAVAGDEYVCDSCLEDDYARCADCAGYVREDSMYSTLHDESVCEGCREYNYSYCDYCDGIYHMDVGCGGRHGGCDCDAPGQQFVLKMGGGVIANDTPVSLELGQGVISETGLVEIEMVIHRWKGREFKDIPVPWSTEQSTLYSNMNWIANQVLEMYPRWQTKEGNFTKRLSKLAYKNHGLKVPAEVMTEVGNIAAAHSQGARFQVEFTRNLNGDPEDFAHGGSCWWGEYGSSRCALKSNGGLALRTFKDTEYVYADGTTYHSHEVEGRAWVMPVKQVNGYLMPTCETENPAGFVVFNGYGNVEGYQAARIVAQMYGWTYRKITFGSDPMYINSDAGYLVGPEDVIDRESIDWDLGTHADLYHREAADAAAESTNERELAHA